jgi:hypothetical protein
MKTLEQVFIHILGERVSVNYVGVQADLLGTMDILPNNWHATNSGTLELARLDAFESALRERGFVRAPDAAFGGTLYCWTRERDDTTLKDGKL